MDEDYSLAEIRRAQKTIHTDYVKRFVKGNEEYMYYVEDSNVTYTAKMHAIEKCKPPFLLLHVEGSDLHKARFTFERVHEQHAQKRKNGQKNSKDSLRYLWVRHHYKDEDRP